MTYDAFTFASMHNNNNTSPVSESESSKSASDDRLVHK